MLAGGTGKGKTSEMLGQISNGARRDRRKRKSSKDMEPATEEEKWDGRKCDNCRQQRKRCTWGGRPLRVGDTPQGYCDQCDPKKTRLKRTRHFECVARFFTDSKFRQEPRGAMPGRHEGKRQEGEPTTSGGKGWGSHAPKHLTTQEATSQSYEESNIDPTLLALTEVRGTSSSQSNVGTLGSAQEEITPEPLHSPTAGSWRQHSANDPMIARQQVGFSPSQGILQTPNDEYQDYLNNYSRTDDVFLLDDLVDAEGELFAGNQPTPGRMGSQPLLKEALQFTSDTPGFQVEHRPAGGIENVTGSSVVGENGGVTSGANSNESLQSGLSAFGEVQSQTSNTVARRPEVASSNPEGTDVYANLHTPPEGPCQTDNAGQDVNVVDAKMCPDYSRANDWGRLVDPQGERKYDIDVWNNEELKGAWDAEHYESWHRLYSLLEDRESCRRALAFVEPFLLQHTNDQTPVDPGEISRYKNVKSVSLKRGDEIEKSLGQCVRNLYHLCKRTYLTGNYDAVYIILKKAKDNVADVGLVDSALCASIKSLLARAYLRRKDRFLGSPYQRHRLLSMYIDLLDAKKGLGEADEELVDERSRPISRKIIEIQSHLSNHPTRSGSDPNYWLGGDTSLHDAAKENDLVEAQRWVDLDLPLDRPNSHGLTALCLASEKGHYDFVKFLYVNGANLNSSLPGGRSPLFFALHHSRDPRIAKLLISAGDDIELGHPVSFVKDGEMACLDYVTLAKDWGNEGIVELLKKALESHQSAFVAANKSPQRPFPAS